jgi:hypothetical protein
MRFSAIFLLPMAGLFCQGCVIFPYPTPEVKGVVIDAATKKPIPGVRVAAIRKPKYIKCDTLADGSFDLHANHIWGPCFLMPGDYLDDATVSFSATGYQAATNGYLGMPVQDEFGGYVVPPVVLVRPIELQKQSQP